VTTSGDGSDRPSRRPKLEIIAELQWRVAKTMPEIPHEYTVRSPETEAAYVALFEAIQSDGVVERYNRRRKRYLYPGDGRKYWAMTTHLPSSRVLNRMKIEDDLPRLRQEGQTEAVAFGLAELRTSRGQ
jgi:hypothetical protein